MTLDTKFRFRYFLFHRQQRAHLIVALSACFFVLSGCGESESRPLIKGKVTYQGTPLDRGSLRFYGADGRPIGSVIQKDGSYEIKLLPGDYQVSVSLPPRTSPEGDIDGSPPLDAANTLPDKYMRPTTSDLRFSVPPQQGTVDYDIDMR